jgi:uncharacterized protein YxjI
MMSTLKFNFIRKKAGNSDKKINLKNINKIGKTKERFKKHFKDKKMCAWEGKVFVSYFCVKRFDKKSDMNWHMAVHEKIWDFAYRLCDNKRSDQTVHERVYTGGKPYKCLNCGKSFKHKVSLKGHMNNHLGIKEF